MPLSFPDIAQFAFKVGQTPWLLGAVSAADALVGLLGLDRAEFVGDRRVQGDPRRPGGLPYLSDIARSACASSQHNHRELALARQLHSG